MSQRTCLHIAVIVLLYLVPAVGARAQTPGEFAPSSAPVDPDSVEAPPPPPAPEVTALPPPSVDGVRVDAAAETQYRACVDIVRTGDTDAARICFVALKANWPDSAAALKAEASLTLIDLQSAQKPTQKGPGDGLNIPPGRLGVTAVTGLFGAWNALAAGIIVANFTEESVPLVVATGLSAVAVGVGFGTGGYFLAERLQLDEGAARLVASSLLWGTLVGATLAPAVDELVRDPNAFEDRTGVVAGVATVVGSGYLLGGVGLLLASRMGFDEAQVGLINSGGIVFGIGGLALLANAAPNLSPITGSVVLSSSVVLGLLAGGALGRVLDMTWGEVLLSDLGGLLGLIAGAAVGIGVGAQGPSPLPVSIGVVSGMTLGYASAIGLVSFWRTARGAPLLREPTARLTPMTSMAFDGRHVVPTLGFGLRF